MILPTGATSFTEAMRMGSEVYHHLKGIIKKAHGRDATNVGDEGGFAPPIKSAEEGLDLLVAAIEKAGYTGKIKIAMDVAASEFAVDAGKGGYDLQFKQSADGGAKDVVTGEALGELFSGYCEKYPIVSIEDAFDQDDWEAWAALTGKVGDKVQIVGDDLLVTNPKRVQRAIDGKNCNALLLKVN